MKKARKWTEKEVNYIKDNYALLSNQKLALELKRTIPSIEKKAYKLGLSKDNASVDDMAEYFSKMKENLLVKKQLKKAIEENLKLKQENEAIVNLKKKYTTSKINESKGEKKEAVPVIQISDWHIDEKITLQQTNGLNEFNLDIAKYRVNKLSISIVKIIRDNWSKTFTINKAVIQLGGDFIGGNIHEELIESNTLSVMTASVEAQNMLASLLIFLQKNLPNIKFIAVCNVGNHPRITKKLSISTEAGNNLETYLYANLQYNLPNIEFIINDSYHKYLDILGFKCRFHHGHAIRYGGGIGGIFISAYKKISQWNKAKAVDYDFFGHFHQCKDGGNFMCNGSLVGYNPFAIRIGADYETPKQTMSLITSGRGLTTTWKISL